MLARLSKREKVAVSCALLALLLFVLLQLFLFPLLEKRGRLQGAISSREKQLAEMVELEQRYQDFSRKNQSLAKLLEQRDKGFSLFSFVESSAADSGVKGNIAYMKPAEISDNELLEQSFVEMKLQAISIVQLVSFLEKIESPRQVVGIRRVSIQENSKAEGTLDVTVQIVSVDAIVEQGS
ncbi:type II secretion system protein GspM [Desulfogranum mediterraneum]|uniref:type II secretion system protein GspM n=1 Tax=Desulfogranum mediterraneum TaxID=160661 RepID=UPI00041103F5|nr:type II secretion system protein GspM [Desulfogranum mediterraneum]